MRKFSLVLIPLLVLPVLGHTHENDYPTMDSVRFVVECMAELGEQNEENLYTCSCRHDAIAGMLSFETFERATFFKRYSRMPGKRGGLVRDSKEADELVKKMDNAYKVAEEKCPTVKHIEVNRENKEE